jgi:hypothetical protein
MRFVVMGSPSTKDIIDKLLLPWVSLARPLQWVVTACGGSAL